MRVSYSSAPRLVKLKGLLDEQSDVLDTYIAMQYKRVGDKMKFTPVINNLIFVHSTQERISQLKRTQEVRYFRATTLHHAPRHGA